MSGASGRGIQKPKHRVDRGPPNTNITHARDKDKPIYKGSVTGRIQVRKYTHRYSKDRRTVEILQTEYFTSWQPKASSILCSLLEFSVCAHAPESKLHQKRMHLVLKKKM